MDSPISSLESAKTSSPPHARFLPSPQKIKQITSPKKASVKPPSEQLTAPIQTKATSQTDTTRSEEARRKLQSLSMRHSMGTSVKMLPTPDNEVPGPGFYPAPSSIRAEKENRTQSTASMGTGTRMELEPHLGRSPQRGPGQYNNQSAFDTKNPSHQVTKNRSFGTADRALLDSKNVKKN